MKYDFWMSVNSLKLYVSFDEAGWENIYEVLGEYICIAIIIIITYNSAIDLVADMVHKSH